MTPQYTILPAADRDLDDQAGYLAREAGIELALRFYDAAATSFANLAQMPGIGERWESTNPHLALLRVFRIIGFERHLVFYRPTDGGIEIVRVLHGARDLGSVLEEE